MKGTLGLVLAFCLIGIPALSAASETAPEVAITTPEEGLTIASRTVTVEATYTAREDALVETVELVIDDIAVAVRAIDPPQAEGVVSFVWAARGHTDGDHTVCVRAIDSHGEVGKKTITVLLQRELPRPGEGVRIVSPADGSTVSGEQPIQIQMDQPKLARYVIFLIDDVFKAMSNVRPFTYMWDTTRYLNGPHSLKVKAYLGGQWEAISPVVRVNVNNPSGATAMRDPKPAALPARPARAGTPTLPPAMRTESPTPLPPPMAVPELEVAMPGTVPFVSPAGDLIRPPAAPAVAQPPPTSEPIEIAALPPSVGLPVVPAERPVGPAMSADVPAIAPAEAAAVPVPVLRTPVAAPLEIALLEAEPPAAPAPAMPMAEVAAAPRSLKAAPPTTGQVAGPAVPAASGIEVAMLPPRPVERKPAPRVVAEPAPAPTEVVYVVQSGDWLNRIAAETGVPAAEIARANNLENPSLLSPGQTLVIPTTSLYFDGRPVISEVPTVVVGGQAITPFRPVIEEAGGVVLWDGAERRASGLARGHEIAVTIGSDQAQVDGGQVAMGAPAELRSNRTVVPVRFLGDALDLVLQYEDGIIHLASGR